MTILILDDEPCLVKVIGVYLKRSGHTVLESMCPESALAQFQEVKGAVDLLITDVGLEVSSGVELGLQLRALTPTLRLLFTSGYPFTAWSARDTALYYELPPDAVRVLQKPFSALGLLTGVSELLEPYLETVRSCQGTASA